MDIVADFPGRPRRRYRLRFVSYLRVASAACQHVQVSRHSTVMWLRYHHTDSTRLSLRQTARQGCQRL